MNNEQSPFSNPNDVNPFASQPTFVGQETSSGQNASDEYNPFAEDNSSQTVQATTQQPVYAPPQQTVQPATIEPVRSDPPPSYHSKPLPSTSGGYGTRGDESMRQRQEELERKAAELEKKEQELKKIQGTVPKENNFPPFPACCKIKPCFYHDISLEVPIEWQRTCRLLYYIWQVYVFTIFFNFICALAGLSVGMDGGATCFGVSILWLVLNTPCSFLCWYRPIYKALRSNSSFNFMLFFFVFFFQIILCIVFAFGISSFGSCGWINGAGLVDKKERGVAAMFFISGGLFTLQALCMIYLLRKIHGAYRNSGASFQKAQKEFITDVASNKNVQNAAADAFVAGVQSQNKTNY